MTDMQTASAPPPLPRLVRVDIARGMALVGVMIFHLCWDLRYFEFVLWPMDTAWGWIGFQKLLVGSFVGLSGLSLYLAHGRRVRWRAFWRRWLVLAGAALLITGATWFTFQPAFVYFGILHALALFALLGLAALLLPAELWIPIGIFMLVVGIAHHDPAFNEKPLSWLGFWVVPPYTNDLVPVFPWFGIFLMGMGFGRTLTQPQPGALIAGPADWGWFGRALKWIGRHSLILYLVHQPLLLGVLVPLETILQPQTWHRAERFVSECEASCGLGAADPGYCRRYCACSLEQIESGQMWDTVSAPAPAPTAAQRRDIDEMIGLCVAMGQAGDR
ncbi:MAG: DUF1624 domain-containing protein [Alphaproteobacteria bacterium]|nr:DUF1624 domain-containing protein [Alphaproteobacteria bacterium]